MLRRSLQVLRPAGASRRALAAATACALAAAGCVDVRPFDAGDVGADTAVIADSADPGDTVDAAPDSAPLPDTEVPRDTADALDAVDARDAAEVVTAPPGEPGETCAEAGAIDPGALPWLGHGTTAEAEDDYDAGGCPGAPVLGGGTGDVVYRFTPAVAGVYTFALPDAGPLRPGPAMIAVVTACGGGAASCVAVSPDLVVGGVLRASLEAGQPYFVVLDGLYAGDAGPYTLTVSAPCQPACSGGCGPDGCGGSCGVCGGGAVCAQGGLCDAPAAIVGNSCANPFTLAAVPYQHADDTGYGSDALSFAAGTCAGFWGGQAVGAGRRDHVFRFVPDATATYVFRVAADFDAALAVMSACGATDAGGACLGASDRVGVGVEEQVALRLTTGVAAWVVIDGGARAVPGSGEGGYVLTASGPCYPDCSGKICGDDGCFGSCGVCPEAEVCRGATGQCEAVVGNTCDAPLEIGGAALPFAGAGDTAEDASDTFAWSAGACPDVPSQGGAGAPDQVWRFVAPARGVYTARVAPGFDATLTVLAGACATGGAGCVGGSDASGAGGSEAVLLDLAAGEERWLVVDGFAGAAVASGPYTLTVSAPCVPACGGRECGPSGCGTSCGTCPPGSVCELDGRCEQPVGSGCGAPFVVDAGALPFAWEGSTASGATPSFATSLDCGPSGVVAGEEGRDQVFAFTPPVDGVYTIELEATFDAILSVRQGCDGAATTCLAAESRLGEDERLRLPLEAGTAYAIVVDGFEADAHGAYTLRVSAPCAASCGARVCGEDGCGLTCGECAAELACAPAGACVAPSTLAGNVCEQPFETGPAPFVGAGNTLYASDALTLPQGACGAAYPALGGGAPEQVWRFVAPSAGVYRVTLDASFLASLYALSSCGAASRTPPCLAVAAGDGHEELVLPLQAGQEVRLVVDGLGGGLGGRGPYTLRVSSACTPACGGRSCGPDGCGGSCGACVPGLSCEVMAGACLVPALVPGDRCDNPFILPALPAQVGGTTAAQSDDLSAPSGACPGLAGGWGEASPEVVYRFTPPAPGTYAVRLVADFDALLYAVRDCGAVASTCLAGSDGLGLAPEVLTLSVTDTSPLYLVVDGYSNTGDVSGAFTLEVTGP